MQIKQAGQFKLKFVAGFLTANLVLREVVLLTAIKQRVAGHAARLLDAEFGQDRGSNIGQRWIVRDDLMVGHQHARHDAGSG